MLIKTDMEETPTTNHINHENINIIKKIIDDFEKSSPTGRNRSGKKVKHKKISNSDSFIHRYKRSQVSPKTTGSLDGQVVKCKPSNSLEEFLQKENDVYINFFENCDNENADANAFMRFTGRKSVFKSSGIISDGFLDEYKVLRETKGHQERVKKNVKEIYMHYSQHRCQFFDSDKTKLIPNEINTDRLRHRAHALEFQQG
ncbi:hypothetical protein NQ317_017161 [Molorchus minor]|uniref:Uncharacterized protein n=1 Tax=Molorchus minor TaxID=1323400 RepID=A0ABQ9J089_9CUCU|nr:hypothetical protein NQ317_017161 [Molorchus minor]